MVGQKWCEGKRGKERDHTCSLGNRNDGVPSHRLQTSMSRANLGRRSGTHLDVLQPSPGCVTFTAYWIPSGDIKQATSTYSQEFRGGSSEARSCLQVYLWEFGWYSELRLRELVKK